MTEMFVRAFNLAGNLRDRPVKINGLLSEPCLVIVLLKRLSVVPVVNSAMFSVRDYLKVLRSIVKSISVYVMDGFSWLKVSAKDLLHHESVNEDIPMMVPRVIDHTDAPVTHPQNLSAFPSWMGGAAESMLGETGRCSWHKHLLLIRCVTRKRLEVKHNLQQINPISLLKIQRLSGGPIPPGRA